MLFCSLAMMGKVFALTCALLSFLLLFLLGSVPLPTASP